MSGPASNNPLGLLSLSVHASSVSNGMNTFFKCLCYENLRISSHFSNDDFALISDFRRFADYYLSCRVSYEKEIP